MVDQFQSPQLSMQFVDRKTDNQDLYRWLFEQKKELKSNLIAYLSNREKRVIQVKDKIKSPNSPSGYKSVTKEREDWVPVTEDDHPLMDLSHAIELSTIISELVDPLFSTTWTDPNTRTVKVAGLYGLMCGHALDNPRFNFQGNESDASFFTLWMCREMEAIINRSKGGFAFKQISESTINTQTRNLSDFQNQNTGFQMPKKPTLLDRGFKPR